MNRTLFSLIAMAMFSGLAIADSPPTKEQTIEYIKKKFSSYEISGIRRLEGYDDKREENKHEVTFERKASKTNSNDNADFITNKTTRAGEGNDTHIYHSSCQLSLLDPSTVRMSKIESFVADNGDDIYYVEAECTNGETVAYSSSTRAGSGIYVAGQDSKFGIAVPGDKSAQILKKSLEHLIRECGGKVSTKKPEPKPMPKPDPTEAFFESGIVTNPGLPVKSTAANEKTMPPSTTGKRANDTPRRTVKKEIEKQIITAEAQLAIAMREDAANQEWNDAQKAKLQKRLADSKAEAADASAKGAKLKYAAAAAAVIATGNELADEKSWKKKTDAADRLRQQIAELKKTLIDLQD